MKDGSLVVNGEYTSGRKGQFKTVWVPERNETSPGRPRPPFPEAPFPPREETLQPDHLPKLDEYVYVEELPEALTTAPPEYPAAAREARVQGTVVVQALVGADGRVKETKISKSIPDLDEAA